MERYNMSDKEISEYQDEIVHRYGRPRLKTTMERDDAIFDLLETPHTLLEIANKFDLPYSLAYQSINRLRRDGRIEKGERVDSRTYQWKRTI